MHQSQWEIVILKPTSVFLSFLASQLPEVDLPDLNLLQTDTTAYTIPRHDNEEDTLDEIERHFTTMFRHEICRWLGKDARNEIEGSFLDFLCCFKFELHSQIVLMEPSIHAGQQLLCVKPRSVLLKWMKSSAEDQSDLTMVLEKVNLSHLAENATVIVKNFKDLAEVKPFIKHYYRPIFKAEMLRMCDRAEQWPYVDSFEAFSRYFSVEIHTQLIHLH
ncbi:MULTISPECIES: hypothetical protein [Legionella]|uniref:hypothetical protein n=1 Tax=Legionella TaxID=445 RepID=UPI000F8CF01C|nr:MULTISPECIES: hypothetical protein [Legionella]MCP0913555.1 hypothetical protein [Legionella sp. 27cVA30]RUQ99783.1 hypothetical protein ELY11_04170 [Legionella septentrionalis]RUR11023.1 hypothetical protein ELY14_02855 [Legionella septentrionalis]RUR15909.1 hypothetical protein ELY10_04475 [Legionella septentrionalis]